MLLCCYKRCLEIVCDTKHYNMLCTLEIGYFFLSLMQHCGTDFLISTGSVACSLFSVTHSSLHTPWSQPCHNLFILEQLTQSRYKFLCVLFTAGTLNPQLAQKHKVRSNFAFFSLNLCFIPNFFLYQDL